MKRFLNICRLPENLETLFLLVLGIVLQVTDGSPFSLKERWMLVWDTELPTEFFNVFVQKFIKSVLSVIVAVRCSTTYAYVVSAMLVIFCILKSSSPKLMLLWLLIAGVKSVFMTFLEALTGVYVCSAFGKIRKACIEFFISKALELIFAAYLWGNVLNIYQEMERKAESSSVFPTKEQLFLQNFNTRTRQRARSLVDESTLYKTACLNNFEFRDVPQIILQMLRRSDEMSEDSLLGSRMMLASVSNLGSFESLKTSQSLGELGFVDLETTEVFGLDEDETLSYQEKALRFLKLTRSDVLKIKQNKTPIGNDIYTMDQDTWKSVVATGTRIHKPKQARTQVFIRDIPELELGEGSNTSIKPRKKSADKKFGFSFSDFFNERQFMFEEIQDDEFFSQGEEDDDDDSDNDQDVDESNIFMSNIKEGIIVNPNRLGIVSRKLKKNAYEELYKQDFMNTIGPEVFDKAPKLPRVTSLANINKNLETRVSVSLPALPEVKNTTKRVSIFEIDGTSSSDLRFEYSKENDNSFQPAKSSQEEQANINAETKSKKAHLKKDKNLIIFPVLESNNLPNERAKTLEKHSDESQDHRVNSKPSLRSMDLTTVEVESCEDIKDKPCYRKKRVVMRRIEKKKKKWSRTPSADGQHLSNNSSFLNFSKSRVENESPDNRKDSDNTEKIEILSCNSEISDSVKEHETQDEYNKHIYFLTELFQKPLLDVLVTYYDLKKKVHVRETGNLSKNNKIENEKFPLQNFQLRRYEKILQSLEHFPKENKIWKSKVLKTVELVNRPGRVDSSSNLTRKELILKKILKYELASLKSKNFRNLKLHSRDSTHWSNAKTEKICISDESITSKLESSVILHPDSEEIESWKKEENFVAFSKTVAEEETVKLAAGNESTPTNGESEFVKAKSSTNIEKEQETPQNLAVEGSPLVLGTSPDGESLSSQESDEPISLYYSKAANLASPLFDMKRFIYPDHIHYSYKHVKKKGFDVDINGGLPLLVRESLTVGTPPKIGSKPISKNLESEITRKPMDLSFAATNAFAEWQNNEQIDVDVISSKNIASGRKERNSSDLDVSKNKKVKSGKWSKKNSESKGSIKSKPTSFEGNFNQIKYLYSAKDLLIEKLLRMHKQFNDSEFESGRRGRKPMQISSTQLHSNKGRINSTYNPAIFLQENKSRSERRKVESQEKRTKDMFARLEREALLQSKNVYKSFSPNRG